MKTKVTILIGVLGLTLVAQTPAQSYVLEPDNYPDGTVLNSLSPQLTLVTAGADNLPIPFNVTATYDAFGFPSTGTNVFGHAGGIPFWNSDRRLRMDFSLPVGFLAIDFIGGDLFTNDTARLDVFNGSGILLQSYLSNPRAAGSVETMSISRSAGDIAWAVAYLPAGGGSFGRLDRLQYGVPEPSGIVLMALGGLIWRVSARRQSRARRSFDPKNEAR